MFGSYRTILALLVLCMHLFELPMLGSYAVFAFYILSGYLMTLIMHGTYGYTWVGLKKYAINRFLRLYPMYFAVLFFAIALVWALPDIWVIRYFKVLYIPEDLEGWFANLTFIFPMFNPAYYEPRLVPTTWALTVEMFNYFLVAIGFSRTAKASFIWLGLSLVYVGWTFANGLNYEWRYHTIFAGCLPFAVGSLIYHYRDSRLGDYLGDKYLVILPIAFFANAYVAHRVDALFAVCWYINVVLNAAFIFKLLGMGRSSPYRKLDTAIGKYSYPIYLLHWPVGLIVCYTLWDRPATGAYFSITSSHSLISGAVSLLVVFALSFVLIKLIDEKVDKVRASVKLRKS
ncbi:MAG: acyltransferase [Gammaproteobacteria bacterium]|nr:acyltransferase [Gammaproteobacteria bacterium]MDP6616611.1 acyltransferase [Gammaproteobacteria bacterium]MDP6694808.1 acyltransferase [Gammaproteobacteria bacterium]